MSSFGHVIFHTELFNFSCVCVYDIMYADVYFLGLSEDQAIKFACQMGFGPHCVEPAADIFMKLYNLFIQKDCTLVEINPMTEISTGEGMY